MHARRLLDDDGDYHSLERDEDYKDDAYDEMMKELKEEDRYYGDDDSQEEEKLQDGDDIDDGIVIIYKYL